LHNFFDFVGRARRQFDRHFTLALIPCSIIKRSPRRRAFAARFYVRFFPPSKRFEPPFSAAVGTLAPLAFGAASILYIIRVCDGAKRAPAPPDGTFFRVFPSFSRRALDFPFRIV
jgi:hypothetical protein